MSKTDNTTDVPIEPAGDDRRSGGMPRWVKFTVLGLIAAVILFFGAIFLYAKVLNDSPDEFTAADIDAALSAEAADDAAATAEAPATATTPTTVDAASPPVAST